ncbi:MAG: pimeloyl-ACP methyl ester carboxylesterase [Candidatus Azotimanducaceae bacterium]|jgi:pimeloyl-ACP methyl ester carboxylesterase
MSNASWRAQRLEQLNAGSEVADTRAGPIEFVRSGSPPYVLQLHGTPGGYDQSVPLGGPFLEAGMGSISVSRPGYLRTPISVGRTPEEQADALAALLDTLQIERVGVQGVSGGGPCAIQFAVRHPGRISALILTCAVSGAYPVVIPGWSKLLMTPLGMRFGEWMLAKFPQATVKQLIAEESTYSKDEVNEVTNRVMNDPSLLSFVATMTQSSTPWEDRQHGFDNDLKVIFGVEDKPLPLESVACPTLIVHGTADDDVPYTVAVQAHERIAESELYAMENACHLLWIDANIDEMNRRQVAFIHAHT